MSPSATVRPLLNALAAVQLVLDAWSEQGAIIGGVAASLLGRPRYTADVDAVVLVSTEELSEFSTVTLQAGLIPRVPNAEAFARRNRVLLLRHAESGVDVDMSLGALLFEEQAVARHDSASQRSCAKAGHTRGLDHHESGGASSPRYGRYPGCD